ncbi:response regulator [Brevibacillus sp. FIR094]|uniref:response regulator n=1 Tax=Brevibacillus sp. FIR094 TaxID=3134809 RepID=UPI003D1926D3
MMSSWHIRSMVIGRWSIASALSSHHHRRRPHNAYGPGRDVARAGIYVVAEGKNGKEAVRLTQMWNPHLIIMDVKMPIMDGLTATGIIREHSDAAILLLTAYSQKDMVMQAKAKGICAYLVKPVMEEELLPAVEFVLTGKQ